MMWPLLPGQGGAAPHQFLYVAPYHDRSCGSLRRREVTIANLLARLWDVKSGSVASGVWIPGKSPSQS